MKTFTAFATPEQTLASCYAANETTAPGPTSCVCTRKMGSNHGLADWRLVCCSFEPPHAGADDQASGALWDQRLKQYLVANGVAVLQVHPRSEDMWDNNPMWWAGNDTKSLGGKDAPWLATLFAELRAGAFGELDLGKLVLHGWSGGAHMVSWLIELLYSGAVKYDGVQLAGGVPAG